MLFFLSIRFAFLCCCFSRHDFCRLILQCQSPFCPLWRGQHASGVILKLQLNAYQDSLAFLNMLPAFSLMGLVVEHFEDFLRVSLTPFRSGYYLMAVTCRLSSSLQGERVECSEARGISPRKAYFPHDSSPHFQV